MIQHRLITLITPLVRMALAVLMGTALASVSLVHAQNSDPRARITLPAGDQTIKGTASIQGTAKLETFSRYELSYALEPDLTNWIALGGAVQPVEDGQLGVWNTRPLADGAYALRLQVFGTDGAVVETIIRNITLANAGAAPAADPAAGVVTGTAESEGGVVSEVQSARDTLTVIGDTLGELPGAFVRGGRYALIALGALGAYVLLKNLVSFGIRRFLRRRVDYGK